DKHRNESRGQWVVGPRRASSSLLSPIKNSQQGSHPTYRKPSNNPHPNSPSSTPIPVPTAPKRDQLRNGVHCGKHYSNGGHVRRQHFAPSPCRTQTLWAKGTVTPLDRTKRSTELVDATTRKAP